MSEDILTLDEAARFLKVSDDVVSQLLESGEVAGRKIGGEWRTTRRALTNFVECIPLAGNGCCGRAESPSDDDCCEPPRGRCC